MILISSTLIDPVTNYVIDWIHHFAPEKRVIRINDDSGYYFRFRGKDIYLVVGGEYILLDKIEAFWYRRGRLRYKSATTYVLTEMKQREEELLEEYLEYRLTQKRLVNQYSRSELNKLVVLEMANKLGLSTPETYLVETREDLENLKPAKLITKNFLGGSVFELSDTGAIMYTQDLEENTEIPAFFAPSLIQEKIPKKYELRIFYLAGKCWTMAIFSQDDEQTKSDFRIYNYEKPNRNVPFELPDDIRLKLTRLMESLQLNSGSIDLILTPDNEFIFLEINPIGQFGSVSASCNFSIERELALYLIQDSL